jgi:fibronectin-binding autotransporter adhesin
MKTSSSLRLPWFVILILFAILLASKAARADSATWNLDPATGDWNTASNWTPATVPNGPADTATFELSSQTSVSNSTDIQVNGIIFEPGASAFTITFAANRLFTVGAGGLVNNSGTMQNFINQTDQQFDFGTLVFADGASAGNMVTITNQGASRLNGDGAQISFFGSSSAGSATIINELPRGYAGGKIDFYDTSTAGDATFVDQGSVGQTFGGRITFHNSSTAANASFEVQAATCVFCGSGNMQFSDDSTAGQATFVLEGGTFINSTGATVTFSNNSSAGEANFIVNGAASATLQTFGAILTVGSNVGGATFIGNGGTAEAAAGGTIYADFADPGTGATFIANGGTASRAQGATVFPGNLTAQSLVIANDGTNGGRGGRVYFLYSLVGGPGRIEVFGDGSVDISRLTTDAASFGSIEGNGKILLGSKNLSVGSNNRSTRFHGVIRDGGYIDDTGGSLTKVGTGRLTLLQPSSYTGITTVTSGDLLADNQSGSATGTGDVFVNAGTLGGMGIIAGAVTVGTSTGTMAFLAPAAGSNRQATFTLESSLTLNSDATYTCTFTARQNSVRTDLLIANGVAIDNAMIAISGTTQNALTIGTVLTVISNTSANPISGTFSNLADGEIVTIDGNNLQADYQGGDANDLTLTVVP